MEAGTTPSTTTGSTDDRRPAAAGGGDSTATSVAVKPQGRRRVARRHLRARSARSSREIGRGLIDLGIEPGDRVCILATRAPSGPTPTSRSPRAGARRRADLPDQLARGVRVGRRQLRGPSRSSARTPTQVAKIVAVRDSLPDLRAHHRHRRRRATSATRSRSTTLRERGRGRDAAELAGAHGAVEPDDPFTFIYTSGTTGPPKGCVLTHGNYRSVLDMVERARRCSRTTTTSSTCSCRWPTRSRC